MGNIRYGTRLTLSAIVCLLVVAACSSGTDSPAGTDPPAGPDSLPAGSIAGSEEDVVENGPENETTSPERSLPPDTTLETVPPAPAPVLGEVPADLLDSIRADAAERTGVAPADMEVVRGEAVAWNDGSLGCAEPGQAYTQAIVLGFWVEIDAGGRILDYRANDRGFFKLCEGPSVQLPPTTAPNS